MKTHYNELLKYWYIGTMDSILICSKYKKNMPTVYESAFIVNVDMKYVYQFSNLNVAKTVTGIVAAVIWVTYSATFVNLTIKYYWYFI